MSNPPHLVLNASTVTVDPDATVEVGFMNYEDGDDRLSRIRREVRGTHLVLRGGSEIRIVRLIDAVETIGDRTEEVRLADDPGLLCALVRERLIAMFSEVGNGEIRSHRPVALVSGRPDDNLLPKVLRDRERGRVPPWLARRVKYEFDPRYFDQVDDGVTVMLSFGTRTGNHIEATCDELLAAGVRLHGRYVEVADSGDDQRLGQRRTLVGRVADIKDGIIHLGDPRPGWSEVALADAYLEPRAENLEACVVALVGRDGGNTAERLREASGFVTQGPSRLHRAQRFLSFIRQRGLHLAPGVTASLGDLVASRQPEFPEWEAFSPPTLIFHPSATRTSTVSYKGIDEHGPYDQAVFPHKRPRIAIICQAHRQGDTEKFVESFFEGLPGNVYGKGFLRRFALQRPQVEVFCTRDRSAGAYEAACRAAIEHATDSGSRWDLALVQIEDEFKLLPPAENPYLVTKSVLFRHQVPAQEFTLRTMGLDRNQLTYALNNLSLASYAKLGGTPWVLEADRTVAHELVIGLRSYKHQQSRFGSKGRYVGLTTVFKGDGQYLLEGRTRAVPFEDYSAEMLETLRKAVAAVREQQNWDGRENVRLVFHAFKPMRTAEIDAVRALMEEAGLPNAEFAFVRMVEDHPFALMDTNQPGMKVWSSRGKKGVYAPPRGVFIPMGVNDALLALKGPRSVKQESDGLPRPLLMRVHPASTFTDLRYLARQAYNFSCHSWRTFGPAGMPITVDYSGWIAEMLGQLQAVPGWSDDSMLGRISMTRWFL